jgi:hypothetical protein
MKSRFKMKIRAMFHSAVAKVLSFVLGPVTLTPVSMKESEVFDPQPMNLRKSRSVYGGGCPILSGPRRHRTLSNCRQLESDGPVMKWPITVEDVLDRVAYRKAHPEVNQ